MSRVRYYADGREIGHDGGIYSRRRARATARKFRQEMRNRGMTAKVTAT